MPTTASSTSLIAPSPEPARPDRRTIALAAMFDVDTILLFVLIGRRSHDEGGSFLVETVKVAASFLIALAVAWLVARAWRAPRAARTGAVVWAVTVAVGVALRPVFGRHVQVSFVIVAAVFIGLGLIGWRAVARQVGKRRARYSSVV